MKSYPIEVQNQGIEPFIANYSELFEKKGKSSRLSLTLSLLRTSIKGDLTLQNHTLSPGFTTDQNNAII